MQLVSPSDDISVGDLEIRPHERLVLADGRPVPLSSKEFDIVTTLAEHPGWVFSATQLAEDAEERACSPESVSVLVHRLRLKLAEAGVPDVVETVRGLGYRLCSSNAGREGSPPVTESRRELRDACWELQEAVIEVDRLGGAAQQRAVAEVLEQARRATYSSLAE